MLMQSRTSLAAKVLLVSMTLLSAVDAQTFDPAMAVAKPAAQFKFEPIAPFVKFADAFGDRAGTIHGTFAEIPPQTSSPPHTHTFAYHGVVIKGVMINPFNGEKNPPKLGPGSYWYVPASVVHRTACVSKVPCLFYTHWEGKFDFLPVQ
jgi:mannose-6-phosphate isomerase-like protein (cupin superfamily)